MQKTFKYSVFFVVFLLVISTTARSQFYMTMGYNAGFPTSFSNLNYVIDRYNETRSYLDTEMKHITYLDGMTISMGGMFGPLLIGCGYTGGGQKRYADMTGNDGSVSRRELWVKERKFDMDFGVAIADKDKGGLFLGGTMSVGGVRVNTRTGLEGEIKKEKWTKINPWGDLLFTGGVFLRLQFRNPGIYIEPYFHFTPGEIFQNDITEINENLNPNTYQNDPAPLNVKYNMVGIKIGMGLFTGDN